MRTQKLFRIAALALMLAGAGGLEAQTYTYNWELRRS